MATRVGLGPDWFSELASEHPARIPKRTMTANMKRKNMPLALDFGFEV